MTVVAETVCLSKEFSPISIVSVNVKICSWTEFRHTPQFPLKWTKFCFPFSLDMCIWSTRCSSGTWVQTYWWCCEHHYSPPDLFCLITELLDVFHSVLLREPTEPGPKCDAPNTPLVCTFWIVIILPSVAGVSTCDFLWNYKCRMVPQEVIYRDPSWLAI